MIPDAIEIEKIHPLPRGGTDDLMTRDLTIACELNLGTISSRVKAIDNSVRSLAQKWQDVTMRIAGVPKPTEFEPDYYLAA